MSFKAWIFLILSWSFVAGLVCFSFYHIFGPKKQGYFNDSLRKYFLKHHGPLPVARTDGPASGFHGARLVGVVVKAEAGGDTTLAAVARPEGSRQPRVGLLRPRASQ